MKPTYHVSISLIFAWWIFAAFKSWEFALATIVSGIFIDIDHFFGYVKEFGWNFKLDLFFRASYEGLYQRSYLLFHGWEWAILLAVLTYASAFSEVFCGLLVGYLLHITLDQIFNRPEPWAYSIIWRRRHKFEANACFPHKDRDSL